MKTSTTSPGDSHVYAVTLVSGLVVIGEAIDFTPLIIRSPMFLRLAHAPSGDHAMFFRIAPYADPDHRLDRTLEVRPEQYLGVPYRVTPDVKAAYTEAVRARNEAAQATIEASTTQDSSGAATASFQKG